MYHQGWQQTSRSDRVRLDALQAICACGHAVQTAGSSHSSADTHIRSSPAPAPAGHVRLLDDHLSSVAWLSSCRLVCSPTTRQRELLGQLCTPSWPAQCLMLCQAATCPHLPCTDIAPSQPGVLGCHTFHNASLHIKEVPAAVPAAHSAGTDSLAVAASTGSTDLRPWASETRSPGFSAQDLQLAHRVQVLKPCPHPSQHTSCSLTATLLMVSGQHSFREGLSHGRDALVPLGSVG